MAGTATEQWTRSRFRALVISSVAALCWRNPQHLACAFTPVPRSSWNAPSESLGPQFTQTCHGRELFRPRREFSLPIFHVVSNEEQVNVLPETVELVQDFVSKVQDALNDKTFVSLTLNGPSLTKKEKQHNEYQKDRLRGCIRLVQGRLIILNRPKQRKEDVFLQTTIKYHGATDVAKNWNVAPESGDIETGLTSLLLSDANVLASEWGENTMFPCGHELGIQKGDLCTTEGTWEFEINKSKSSRPHRLIFRSNPDSLKSSSASTTSLSHDRAKQVPLPSEASFLQALGLSAPDGKPRPGMSSKLKQCQKFVEIASGLVESSLVNRQVATISTVDMGCGRGYLTFALHSYLSNKYGSTQSVSTCGIDVRPKLVTEITGIARSLGQSFDGLTFEEGTIASALAKQTAKQDNSLSVLIALHACDTATDDALWSGIQNGSNVIVVAPCCHKEVRRHLDPHVAKMKGDHPLADVLRHNIYRERIAETVTDSLRALLLEIANYNVQVFEFIGGEHTSKNVMITAVKRQRSRNKTDLLDLRQRLCSLANLHGVKEQRLAKWMGETIAENTSDTTGPKKLSSKQMPPLR